MCRPRSSLGTSGLCSNYLDEPTQPSNFTLWLSNRKSLRRQSAFNDIVVAWAFRLCSSAAGPWKNERSSRWHTIRTLISCAGKSAMEARQYYSLIHEEVTQCVIFDGNTKNSANVPDSDGLHQCAAAQAMKLSTPIRERPVCTLRRRSSSGVPREGTARGIR